MVVFLLVNLLCLAYNFYEIYFVPDIFADYATLSEVDKNTRTYV